MEVDDNRSDLHSDEENDSLLIQTDNNQKPNDEQKKVLDDASYQRKKSEQIIEEYVSNQGRVEKLCILMVIVSLFFVILIIIGILVTTFKEEQTFMRLSQLLENTQIRVPTTENRKYQTILLSNNLKVLLVEDPSSQNSYAAMDVGAGSWNEPSYLGGLAHFLEHMIFLKSKKYSEVAYFDKLLSQNGGFSNAYTTDQHTNYFFKVSSDAFEQTLNIFAEMFVQPIFEEEQAVKEASNVASEFEIDVGQYQWMLNNLISLMCDSDHPLSRFSIGNVDSLIIQPKKHGIDVAQELSRFWKKFYSSNIMSLVLYSNKNISDMQQYVMNSRFRLIPNREIEEDDLRIPGKPLHEDNIGTLQLLEIKDSFHTLELIYQLESLKHNRKKRALEYVQFLITHPGKNGFSNFLKEQKLIFDLAVSAVHESDDFSMVLISFQLTELGHQQISTIIVCFSTYISKILDQGIIMELYDQLRIVSENNFEYSSVSQSEEKYDQVSNLAFNLNSQSLSEVLSSEFEYEEFDEVHIRDLVIQLRMIENAVIVNGSPTIFSGSDGEGGDLLRQAVKESQSEIISSELYQFRYQRVHLTEDLIERLKEEDQVFSKIVKLPALNEFITKDKSLRSLCDGEGPDSDVCLAGEKEVTETCTDYPIEVEEDYFYKFNMGFKSPRIVQIIRSSSILGVEDYKGNLMNRIQRELLQQQLEVSLADCLSAGYTFEIQYRYDGLIFILEGWPDKFAEFQLLFLKTVNAPRIDEDLFEWGKSEVLEDLQNVLATDPLHQAFGQGGLQRLLLSSVFDLHLEINNLDEEINYPDFESFFDRYWKEQRSLIYLTGYALPKYSELIQSQTRRYLASKLSAPFMRQTIKKLNRQNLVYRQFVEGNPDNLNSATINYYQVGKREPRQFILSNLIVMKLHLFVYNLLRTQQELGYVVFAQLISHSCVDAIVIGVEGSSQSPDQVNFMIEDSLKEFYDSLQKLEATEFQSLKKALVSELTQQKLNLLSEAEEYFQFIQTQNKEELDFNYYETIKQLVQDDNQIQLNDMIQQFKDIFIDRSGKVSVQFYSSKKYQKLSDELLDSTSNLQQIQEQLVSSTSLLEDIHEIYECGI